MLLLNYIRDILSVDIVPDQITVKSLYTNAEVKDTPLVAINKNLQAAAVGKQAGLLKEQSPPGSLALINPFDHPRVAITDVKIAAELLRGLIERLYGRTVLLPRLTLIIYPPAKLQEDPTALESNAFSEMGHKAGAREIWVIPTNIRLTVQDFKEFRKSGLDTFGPLLADDIHTGTKAAGKPAAR